MKLRIKKGTKLIKPEQVANILHGFLSEADKVEKDREHLYCLGLNTRNVVKYAELVGIGTSTECLISPKEVLRRAVIENVTSIILAHNHPSGEVTPSAEDIQVTAKAYQAGQILGIRVLDHIIINSDGGYYSMKAQGIDFGKAD